MEVRKEWNGSFKILKEKKLLLQNLKFNLNMFNSDSEMKIFLNY